MAVKIQFRRDTSSAWTAANPILAEGELGLETNTSKFKDYVGIELPKIVAELKSIKSKVEDKVTTIKLSETISVLEKMKMGKSVTDGQVSSIMLSYELIKELKSKLK